MPGVYIQTNLPLLPSSIPQLQCNVFVVHFHCLHLKVDPDGCAERRSERVETEAMDEAALADIAVPHENDLE